MATEQTNITEAIEHRVAEAVRVAVQAIVVARAENSKGHE